MASSLFWIFVDVSPDSLFPSWNLSNLFVGKYLIKRFVGRGFGINLGVCSSCHFLVSLVNHAYHLNMDLNHPVFLKGMACLMLRCSCMQEFSVACMIFGLSWADFRVEKVVCWLGCSNRSTDGERFLRGNRSIDKGSSVDNLKHSFLQSIVLFHLSIVWLPWLLDFSFILPICSQITI